MTHKWNDRECVCRVEKCALASWTSAVRATARKDCGYVNVGLTTRTRKPKHRRRRVVDAISRYRPNKPGAVSIAARTAIITAWESLAVTVRRRGECRLNVPASAVGVALAKCRGLNPNDYKRHSRRDHHSAHFTSQMEARSKFSRRPRYIVCLGILKPAANSDITPRDTFSWIYQICAWIFLGLTWMNLLVHAKRTIGSVGTNLFYLRNKSLIDATREFCRSVRSTERSVCPYPGFSWTNHLSVSYKWHVRAFLATAKRITSLALSARFNLGVNWYNIYALFVPTPSRPVVKIFIIILFCKLQTLAYREYCISTLSRGWFLPLESVSLIFHLRSVRKRDE